MKSILGIIRGLFLIARGFFTLLVRIVNLITWVLSIASRAAFYIGLVSMLLTSLAAARRYLEPAAKKIRKKKDLKAGALLLIAGALTYSACAHNAPEKPQEQTAAAAPVAAFITTACAANDDFFTDQLPLESFHEAVVRQLDVWKKFSAERMAKDSYTFADRKVALEDFKQALTALDSLLSEIHDPRLLNAAVRERFDCYRMSGKTGKGDVLITGYYHPMIKGSLKPAKEYPYPLYKRPSDMIQADLGLFREDLKGKRLIGRLDKSNFVPYYDRKQIDEKGALKNKGLELAYVADELDRFFLQIQGSGSLVLPNGQLFPVNYDGQNGQAYVGIGKAMVDDDLLSNRELSMQNIRALLEEDPELTDKYLHQNPSYVFFRQGNDGPRGSGNALVTPRRSIATDKKMYPAGAPVFVKFHAPAFDPKAQINAWVPTSGFMIDQDTGGAIKGPGRVDLYLGGGAWAEQTAGHLAYYGEVYYLLLKPAK